MSCDYDRFQDKQKCLFISLFFDATFKHSFCIPQVLCSSEPSMQSSSPSQTNPNGMHSPLVTHLNSCEVHDGGAATKGAKQLFRIQKKCKSYSLCLASRFFSLFYFCYISKSTCTNICLTS